jgi:hypothetical protein
MNVVYDEISSIKNKKHSDAFEMSEFSCPPSEYRPIVFWSWNEVMEPEEIRRQLKLMKAAGLGGGFIHSRVGLLTEYLSEKWFEAVKVTIEESKKLDFKVYLYDEDKWPSGFAGGVVPLADEKYRMKALIARPVSKKVPDDYKPVGSPHSGIQVYLWISSLGYDWFNGACYSDLMSREAMKYFIEKSYQSYYDRFSRQYGDDIILEFTDEPCTIFRGRLPEGAVPYSNDLPEAFLKLHGYDVSEHLHKLFVKSQGDEQFRIQYFRTINYLFENNFSKQISDWCESHNIGLTGHYMLETEMYGQQLWGTKVMANYRHQHQPGIDHLGRQINEIITGKQCQSVVNQFGKKRMMSELYGCSGQGVSFEDRLWIATQQIQLGVNFLNPHLSLYTMSGCRKRDFPPNLFYQQPWWQVNSAVDTPLSRMCYAMSHGVFLADTLVIHPQESTFALWQNRFENCNDILHSNNLSWDTEPTEKGVKEKIEALDKSFKELMLALLNNQVQYDLGDETLIAQKSSIVFKNGSAIFSIGQMNYKNIILPSMHTISKQTLSRLKEFEKSGGHIYRCGDGPFVLEGEKSDDLEAFLKVLPNCDFITLTEKLKQTNLVQIMPKTGNCNYIWAHLRTLNDGARIILFSNLTRSERFEGQFAIDGAFQGVWLLDHWTGQKVPVDFDYVDGKTILDILLEPVESRILMFDAEQSEHGVLLEKSKTEKSIELYSSDFVVKRLDDNAITLDTAKWSFGNEPLNDTALPLTVIQEMLNERRYTGGLVLEYQFNIMGLSKGKNVRLVLEHPEYYKIKVNGKECFYEGLEPWLDIRFMPIDISDKIIEGVNAIRLECAEFRYGDKANVRDTIARYGTEIESIYIVGDFAVVGQFISPIYDNTYWDRWKLHPDLLALKGDTAVISDTMPLTVNHLAESGLPFYAGKIEYTVKFPKVPLLPEQRLYISLEKLNAACAEIFVDNTVIERIVTRPYQVDITEVYKAGKQLKIVLYSTLRNLLGPHHHSDGEVISTSPASFLPQLKGGQTWRLLAQSWQTKKSPSDWHDDYCLTNFGNVGVISLIVKR